MRFTRLLRCAQSEVIRKKLDHYSAFHPSALSLQQLVDFGINGNQKQSFLFLRKELLVRLANIMKEISLMPEQLLSQRSTKLVRHWYTQSFNDLVPYEENDMNEKSLNQFADDLKSIYERHRLVVETMAEGLVEMRENYGLSGIDERSLYYFLDRFYINRISIRLLISQHILCFGTSLPENTNHIGSIDPHCNVEEVLLDAYENARFLCDRYYMRSPGIKTDVVNAVDDAYPVTIVYVPSHLYHIVFELLKNSMRAVCEHYSQDHELPELRVFIVRGKEDLSIKICDRGGGFSRTVGDQLLNYTYTTAPPPDREIDLQAPLAGLGYGLPISRLYTRYFQGDLLLVSMEGYGTDANIYLKALSADAMETLPVYGAVSRRLIQRQESFSDWSNPFPTRYHR